MVSIEPNFTETNYGIEIVYYQEDNQFGDMCSSDIITSHSLYY